MQRPSSVPDHVARSAIVVEENGLVYTPIPKAACTTILWLLAEAQGIVKERFYSSGILEVTRSLTIHDMSQWDQNMKLAGRKRKEIEQILTSPQWTRVAMVRHPAARLFSAWQSKILLREPRFVNIFGGEEWFPPPPTTAEDVLEGFRGFLRAIGGEMGHPPENVHWYPQAWLLGVDDITYDYIGHAEHLRECCSYILSVLGGDGDLGGVGDPWVPTRTNESVLPYSDSLFEGFRELVTDLYEDDLDAFGYRWPRSEGMSLSDWCERVEPLVPCLRSIIGRNERIGDLGGLRRRQGTLSGFRGMRRKPWAG